jgi:hypothetical protein
MKGTRTSALQRSKVNGEKVVAAEVYHKLKHRDGKCSDWCGVLGSALKTDGKGV